MEIDDVPERIFRSRAVGPITETTFLPHKHKGEARTMCATTRIKDLYLILETTDTAAIPESSLYLCHRPQRPIDLREFFGYFGDSPTALLEFVMPKFSGYVGRIRVRGLAKGVCIPPLIEAQCTSQSIEVMRFHSSLLESLLHYIEIFMAAARDSPQS